jgi:hypothetical protein
MTDNSIVCILEVLLECSVPTNNQKEVITSSTCCLTLSNFDHLEGHQSREKGESTTKCKQKQRPNKSQVEFATHKSEEEEDSHGPH